MAWLRTGKRFSLRIDPGSMNAAIQSNPCCRSHVSEGSVQPFNKDWYLAAAGYNAGENKILRAINMYESRDFWQLSEGSYLKRETKEYVPKLLAAAIIAKDPARYGFADVAYLPPIEFDTVFVPTRTDLELVARLTGVSCDNISELNPELRKRCTPPDYPNYELKLPKGKDIFSRNMLKFLRMRYVEKLPIRGIGPAEKIPWSQFPVALV
jgi:membrane-bound lytic murein transglycosylase D